MKHEGGHNLKIRYDWMHPTAEDFDMNLVETSLFKEWTVLQIEGEEPIPVETVVDTKISPSKK